MKCVSCRPSSHTYYRDYDFHDDHDGDDCCYSCCCCCYIYFIIVILVFHSFNVYLFRFCFLQTIIFVVILVKWKSEVFVLIRKIILLTSSQNCALPCERPIDVNCLFCHRLCCTLFRWSWISWTKLQRTSTELSYTLKYVSLAY